MALTRHTRPKTAHRFPRGHPRGFFETPRPTSPDSGPPRPDHRPGVGRPDAGGVPQHSPGSPPAHSGQRRATGRTPIHDPPSLSAEPRWGSTSPGLRHRVYDPVGVETFPGVRLRRPRALMGDPSGVGLMRNASGPSPIPRGAPAATPGCPVSPPSGRSWWRPARILVFSDSAGRDFPDLGAVASKAPTAEAVPWPPRHPTRGGEAGARDRRASGRQGAGRLIPR